jgi:S-DNA-T family DNA segregation ATPase FtsK/SpoIIIE
MKILNKTPVQNEYSNVYEIEDVNQQLLKSILHSRFISDGIYTLEQYSSDGYSETYFTSPSFDKYSHQPSKSNWTFEGDSIGYELVLEKPMFMPLDTNKFIDLYNKVAKKFSFPVFLQVLLSKRKDNWRESAISQYESFLKGNENFISFKPFNVIQESFLKVINKMGNFQMERDPIDEIDNKILQNCYRFECRIVLFDKENEHAFISGLNPILNELNLFNRLYLKRSETINTLSESINRRCFSDASINNLLSESELYSLLSDSDVKVVVSNLENTTTATSKPTNLIRAIQNNHFAETINLLPFKEKRNLEVDTKIVGQIQQAFSRVKISKEPLEVSNVERGARLQKIEVKIPSDKNYTDIKKNVDNIKAALGKDSLSIEIGDKPETINIYLACDETELIYLKRLLSSPEFEEYAKNHTLPLVLGEDEVGNSLYACLSEMRHLLVAGASGSGKSVFLNCLLITLILYVNPDELALYLIDPKMVEFNLYEGFPQVKEVITDMKKAAELLSKLTTEMDKRYELLSKNGYRDVKGYNKKAENKLPYIIVVVDEYADLVETNPEVESYIQRLGQKARGAGIHLVIATQRPSADILDGAIKSNLTARVSFKLETSSDYVTVFGKGIPFEPLGRGDGCCRIENLPKQYQRFQSPIITLDDDEWIAVIEKLKDSFSDVEISNVELEESVTIDPLEQLKKIIATTGKTKVSELQEEMGIGINKVTELLRELVDEEWLGRDGRKYVVLAEEDELNNYRDGGTTNDN